MKAMTTKEYAEAAGICDGAVRKAVKLGHTLRGVIRREKFGKSHVFYVDKDFLKKSNKKLGR